MHLEILYQDESIVIINKPPDMLVHRSLIDKRETVFAMQILRDQIGQHVFPVHRLDKPTGGALLFALSSEIARVMSEQFAEKGVKKVYLAIVRGHSDAEGHIDYPLKEKLDKIADKKAQKDKPPQDAKTDYVTVAKFELPHAVGRYSSARYSLVMLSPQTGRKHQLRRHMAHINHPIVGDTTHGDGKHNRFIRETFAFKGLALCAVYLSVKHPVSGETLAVTTPDDSRFIKLLTTWGWQRNDFRNLRSQIEQWQK